MKDHLSNLFSEVYSDQEDTDWMKIKKERARVDRDVYIGTHYVSPMAAVADKTAKLMDSIASFQSKGAVLINGNFNARIGSQNDTVSPDKFDIELGIEIDGNDPERNSQDKITNKRGEELLDMCKSLDLFIANGGKTGDRFGNYTCLKWNGNSVVDYLLVSKNIFEQVPIFKVGQFQPMLSDHCPLFYSLEIPKNLKDIREGTPLKNAPRNFLWSDKGIAQQIV